MKRLANDTMAITKGNDISKNAAAIAGQGQQQVEGDGCRQQGAVILQKFFYYPLQKLDEFVVFYP